MYVLRECVIWKRGNCEMSIVHTNYFALTYLGPGCLAQAMKNIMQKFAAMPQPVNIKWTERLPNGMRVTKERLSADDIELVCDLKGCEVSIPFKGRDDSFFHIALFDRLQTLEVTVSCPSGTAAVEIFEMLTTDLSLTAAEFPLGVLQRSIRVAAGPTQRPQWIYWPG
jgi:hypothetical protein